MKKKKEVKNNKIEFVSKEIKRNQEINDDTKKIISFIIILIIVICLVFGLYYLNAKYVNKDKFQDPTTTTTTEAIYDETKTTVSTMFKIKDDNYYVLAYDPNEYGNGTSYRNMTLSYDKDIKLYTLDYSNAMNNKYYNKDGKENTNPTSAKEVMFTRPTLLVFKKGKVVEYITNKEDINNKLS